MKLELLVLGITAFLILNTYKDGKYTEMFTKYKKYYKMGLFGFAGLAFYLFMKKNPSESQNMLMHASNMIKYMPVDRNTTDMLTPLLDFTNGTYSANNLTTLNRLAAMRGETPSFTKRSVKRMMNSGRTANSRSVSQTKKKYVAANQNWKCKMCRQTLKATYEVDHIVPLFKGGSNHVSNLRALCRNCHGEKTINDNF